MKYELQLPRYNIPQAELLDDLRRVAGIVAPRPMTVDAYRRHGQFSIGPILRRYKRWPAAVGAAGLIYRRAGCDAPPAPDAIIADIQRAARERGERQRDGATRLTFRQYGSAAGAFSMHAIVQAFGGWGNAARAAGLSAGPTVAISNEALLANIEHVWRQLGRQPRVYDMVPPLSRYSIATYHKRLGGHRRALQMFIASIDGGASPPAPAPPESASAKTTTDPVPRASADPAAVIESTPPARRTPRTAGWRLRFLTLRRDHFRCRACGRSPAIDTTVRLQLDHIIPWNRGGQTTLDNLQCLCQACNGGKSDLGAEEESGVTEEDR